MSRARSHRFGRSWMFAALIGLAFRWSIVAASTGVDLYQRHCALCHGREGQGVPGAFPPLAGSDVIRDQRERALLAPLEGLSGQIRVNGKSYNGVMPPVALDDEQLAAVLGHVFTSWGNQEAVPTRDEIAATRAKSKFKTVGAMSEVLGSDALPKAPTGWSLSVGVELGFSPSRLARHPDGERVLIADPHGNLWTWKPGNGEAALLFEGPSFIDASLGDATISGLTVDQEGRFYATCNQHDTSTKPVLNQVTIFRTEPWSKEHPWTKPVPWLRTNYSFGVGPYNHGVSHIAQGPDGFLYVASGSRTDGGEGGNQPGYSSKGEEAITACMWRLDPRQGTPVVEVFARGLRNSFGFCWDAAGHLVATENGPDADAAEELNWIQQGHHYGFPYQFADWTKKAYPHTPDLPGGLAITRPFRNVGPAALGTATSLSTFEPHSCPSGIVWLDQDWPAPLGGSFLTARFGNLLTKPNDTGFDVLQLRPDFARMTVRVDPLLAPLGRPIDLLKLSGHRLVIAEFTRGRSLAAGLGTPGRLLVMEPKQADRGPHEPSR